MEVTHLSQKSYGRRSSKIGSTKPLKISLDNLLEGFSKKTSTAIVEAIESRYTSKPEAEISRLKISTGRR
jgi:hypothetical protein